MNYLRTYESIVIIGQQQEGEFLTFELTLNHSVRIVNTIIDQIDISSTEKS